MRPSVRWYRNYYGTLAGCVTLLVRHSASTNESELTVYYPLPLVILHEDVGRGRHPDLLNARRFRRLRWCHCGSGRSYGGEHGGALLGRTVSRDLSEFLASGLRVRQGPTATEGYASHPGYRTRSNNRNSHNHYFAHIGQPPSGGTGVPHQLESSL